MLHVRRLEICGGIVAAALLLFPGAGGMSGQYPPPLLHTPTNHPAQRILLLSVDGLHALDLARWVRIHPDSALSELSQRGVTYTNVRLLWNDEAPGMLALATGGTPLSTGILASKFYDRSLSAPGLKCTSAGVRLDLSSAGAMQEATLPRDTAKGCAVVWPHALSPVNNIFELVRAAGGRTAWAGDRPALVDLYRGPSDEGLSDAVTVESSENHPEVGDSLRVAAVLRWIDGEDSSGKKQPGVPELFGMNFAAFAIRQRQAGYVDALGGMSPALAQSLKRIDFSIARMVKELKVRGEFESTWVVVTATYTDSPMGSAAVRRIQASALLEAAQSVPRATVAELSVDGDAMVWLQDEQMSQAVGKAYARKANVLGIGKILARDELALQLGAAAAGPRMPDLVLQPASGVVWEDSSAPPRRADPEPRVAMLISGTQLAGRSDPTPVPTTQAAALLLRALGLEKLDLTALHQEHSPALPGIF